MERPYVKAERLEQFLVALEQDATLIAVVEMGQASWLVAGILPGLDRYPLKKLGPDRDALLELLQRWRDGVGVDPVWRTSLKFGF